MNESIHWSIIGTNKSKTEEMKTEIFPKKRNVFIQDRFNVVFQWHHLTSCQYDLIQRFETMSFILPFERKRHPTGDEISVTLSRTSLTIH